MQIESQLSTIVGDLVEATDFELATAIKVTTAALNRMAEIAAQRELVVCYYHPEIDESNGFANPRIQVKVLSEVA